MAKKMRKHQHLILVSVLFVIAALVLSVVSSQTAYSLSRLNQVIAMCGGAIALDLLLLVLWKKLPGMVRDLALGISTVLIGAALCAVVNGRVLLMGYIYFSDLESSNPIAVLAMNLAIGAWVAYGAALVLQIAAGFSKHDKD